MPPVHEVVVVLDPDAGEHMLALLESSPVWFVESPANRRVRESWREHAAAGPWLEIEVHGIGATTVENTDFGFPR